MGPVASKHPGRCDAPALKAQGSRVDPTVGGLDLSSGVATVGLLRRLADHEQEITELERGGAGDDTSGCAADMGTHQAQNR